MFVGKYLSSLYYPEFLGELQANDLEEALPTGFDSLEFTMAVFDSDSSRPMAKLVNL
jgi:hypothetical protein